MKTKMTTPLIKNSINRPACRLGFLLIALVCLALSPVSQAAPPPGKAPPDGDLGNGNTAEGTGALFSLTTGINNTAMGFDALFSNTTGFNNTATGWKALFSNTTGGYNTATGLNALFRNTTGFDNTAPGYAALFKNTTRGGQPATRFLTPF